MALSTEMPRTFRLFVSYVDGEGHFLKISGQVDHQASLMMESLFDAARENLENGVGVVPPAAIHEGVICAAKYKDGSYYRAKVINTSSLATGQVGVHFIDYGNKDIISLSAIRFLDSYDPMFLQLRGQATDYYLSGVMQPSGRWEETLLLKLQSLLCYADYVVTVEAQTRSLPIISIQFKGTDLSSHLVSIRFGVAIPLAKQEVLLLQLSGETQQVPTWQPSFVTEPPVYPEHVPFLINQNFPSNPASAMRLQQNVTMPFNGSIPLSPTLIGQRSLVNKASRNVSNLRAPVRQPQHAGSNSAAPVVTMPPSPPISTSKPQSPKKSITYKSKLLEANTQHKVFVSFAEEGPELFAVQLVGDAKKLQDMMDDINKRPHSSLTEPPMIGTVCLGRMSGDRIICRAIVMNLSGSQCKLFFVDFGDTEMVSYYDIFDIPEEFVKPNVFAMRFCLSGVKKLEKGPHSVEAFKQLVNGKVMTLKVVSPEGPPLIQYGELYLDNKNVLELLMGNMKDKLQFKWMEMLTLGSMQSVLVSYVDSCIKFFVQLSDKIDDLNAVMDAVKLHCESSSSPGALPVGAACCARFSDDKNWYRASVRDTRGKKVVVVYVDYGNEQEVDVSDLRTITPDLIRLPAQALQCALKGFENKPVETKTSNQLEMLALEKTLTAHIVGILSTTMVVALIDETVNPPLDVARRMNQLSQPRSSHEIKATTPVRKDAPESFSSPDSASDDGKRKSFRREKSFKEDRRPPREGNEEFLQRGGSFRGRENFDRSGPGRNSDKFAGRAERGDRRGGPPKPRDAPYNNAAPPTVGNGEWEETPSQPTVQPPPPARQHNRENRDREAWGNRDNRDNRDIRDNRDSRDNRDNNRDNRDNNRDNRDNNRDNRDNNRDRRKPRADHQHDKPGPKPNWKKDSSGVGKRLRQAAEAASADAQTSKGSSVQDRLKRDHKFNNQQDGWEEKKSDDWGHKTGTENRPERRDNRGDRRDNWGDKKENWNQREKRDFRGDKPRSNFSPKDRAERSFGSDDRKSDKSFKSNDSGRDRAGRAPPYKSRSKFTRVQYKELSSPVTLDTPFPEPTVEPGAQHEVSVTWIISPESFYTQILSLQPKFLEMMHSIPELYKGVKSYTGVVPVGASVLARYPVDGVLYRATIVSVQPISKFIVRYVDFGNKQLVDAKDIWQLDSQLMELPKMAINCALLGVVPMDGEWKADPDIDLCFNAPRYQCVFQECVEDQHKVSLWNNGASVADMLVEKQLAKLSEHQSSVTLKDEAIDLTIIVGQQILCRVTHVESFEKLYVQLDLDKATLVENAIAAYDTTKLTPLSSDSLMDGVHCTVKHEGKIYRAILEDVADAANIKAVLPDYGNTITTTLDNLMILPTELSVYYYQSLQCSLNNYTADSTELISLEELKTKLTGNKFIIYINSVEEITLVSTLYDSSTGHKIGIFEPDEGAYDEVVQLCMRAVFNYNFGMAYISHAENLNEFYLQKAADGDKIALLLDALYKFYEEGTPEALSCFEVDGLCAAKSADGNWYRATIVAVEDTQVTVQFPDYGNTETLPKESLKNLDTKFFEPCALALVASLGLVALQDDALNKLKELTAEKEVQVTLAFGSDGWLASLHLDGVDLSMKLVNEKLATPRIMTNEEPKEEAVPQAEPISLPEGCTQVYITHIDTPGHFWLQMLDKVDKIEEIQADLQANANNYTDIENRDLGTLCIAKYLADDQWYRAEILDSDADITTVRFIDYGNTDVMDTQPGLIKVIPDSLKEVERYAIKSSVNAVPTGTGQWSEPASDYFTQLVGDLSAPVDALIVLKDVTTYVDIFVNGQNLTDKLVTEGHASRSDEAECGDLPSCFASHVNSPSEFWIQLETATPELQAMEAAMVDAEDFPELTDKEEGVICAAKYPEDGAWYRAQVIVDGSEGTEVLFMDYGNASIANELRSLPDELKAKPALSRKCALQKPRDIKSWSRKSEIKFNELAAEGAIIFNVQFIASGDISIVELYLEGKSVTEELVGLCEEAPATERPTPVGQDLLSSGKVCYVNSLEEFYVHLENSTADLDKVTVRMNDSPNFEPATELKVGSICAAFWADDEQWYRAKILEFCDVGYHVQFIDYGNKAKCEEFRQLPEDLALIEPLAKCCRLAGTLEDNALNETGKNKLEDLATEDTTFQVELLDTRKEPILVRLLINDREFISTIPNTTNENEVAEEPEEANDVSQAELNESFESCHTVIENKSFEATPDNLSDDVDMNKVAKDVTTKSPEKDVSLGTLESSNDSVKTPKRDESKDSINTDTGYTSGENDKEATSPSEKSLNDKDAVTPAEKPAEITETAPVIEKPAETKETEPVIEKTDAIKETVTVIEKPAEITETAPVIEKPAETKETEPVIEKTDAIKETVSVIENAAEIKEIDPVIEKPDKIVETVIEKTDAIKETVSVIEKPAEIKEIDPVIEKPAKIVETVIENNDGTENKNVVVSASQNIELNENLEIKETSKPTHDDVVSEKQPEIIEAKSEVNSENKDVNTTE